MIFVKLKPDANLEDVTQKIEDSYPDLVTIKTADDFNKVNVGLDVIQSASWAISLLAILIGSIGVINTMVMSVFERTREIGVLKASGWRNRRIIVMILGESLVLTLVAYVVGILVGIGAVRVLMAIPSIGNFIQPVYTTEVFIRAFLIAILVGLIGGVYPALRASRLPPTEALRYE
ncbi:MAG: macrolide transporter ATP-binding /permease protein [Methanobacterium sp. PtaU1.Bin242]|nr:MAG: macrolide transporter ATP-binding /permease protein [Methanobacterium sp. PtaU1.Bin242]